MAYRQLVVGDFVKVVRLGKRFGKFGIVEDVNGYNVIVAIFDGRYSSEIVDRFVFVMTELILSQAPVDRYFVHQKQVVQYVDNEDECEYADWDHDDLVERIKQLERQIEEIEK